MKTLLIYISLMFALTWLPSCKQCEPCPSTAGMFIIHLHNFSPVEMDSIYVKEYSSVGPFAVDSLETKGDSFSGSAGYTISVPYSYFVNESDPTGHSNVAISFSDDTVNYFIYGCTFTSYLCCEGPQTHARTFYNLQGYFAYSSITPIGVLSLRRSNGPDFDIYK